MRPEELNHNELLEVDPVRGVVRFAGQRALLLDAVAMGLLREYLVSNFGLIAARAVLTQYGFAHGWRMAEAMQTEFSWDSRDDWRSAVLRILALQGLFVLEPASTDPLSEQGATIVASYEAEQHVVHFGRSTAPVCWTICGLASGYLSRTTGKEIYVLEDHCMSEGAAGCHLLGRTREEWGDARAEELRFFDRKRLSQCLDVSLERVTRSLKAAEQKLRARRPALTFAAPIVDEPLGIVAKSTEMLQLVEMARRIAKFDSTVIVLGESGSGKERIARLIHDESPRAAGPFIAVSCGAITETLLESELFGHARGAFTGASQDRPGLFEAASRGTLFLDEVAEVSPGMQVKLLRVLQEREVRRVGENKVRPVDVRVVAATNSDLEKAVADGRFRQDLYYRLKVVELVVPPLRKRRGDILPLARVLLAEAALRLNRAITEFTPQAADQLLQYAWPGNVRELENAMERAVALARGLRVDRDDLPEAVRQTVPLHLPAATTGAVRPLAAIERDYIVACLEVNRGNQTRTAEQL
ncbi:MAG TPA: sigma 54-interacting transcriptional regulator, partial [Polyangiaceae bacterium]